MIMRFVDCQASASEFRQPVSTPSATAELVVHLQNDSIFDYRQTETVTKIRRNWMRRVVMCTLLLGTTCLKSIQGDTLTDTIIAPLSNFTTPSYSQTGSIPAFNLSYDRLTGESLILTADASISQFYNNTGSATIYPNINGSAGFTEVLNGQTLGTYSVYVSASGAIGPHSSGTVGNTAQQVVPISVPLNTTGSVKSTSNTGSGPGLETLQSVQVEFTYTPIGLTQNDPIQPTSTIDPIARRQKAAGLV